MTADSEFIGLQDAATLTGMSYSTIRSVIANMSETEKEHHVKRTGKRKGVMISKEYLATKYAFEDEAAKESEDKKLIRELVIALKSELKEKGNRLKAAQQTEMMRLMKELIDKGVNPNDLTKVLGMEQSEVTKIIEIGNKSNK